MCRDLSKAVALCLNRYHLTTQCWLLLMNRIAICIIRRTSQQTVPILVGWYR